MVPVAGAAGDQAGRGRGTFEGVTLCGAAHMGAGRVELPDRTGGAVDYRESGWTGGLTCCCVAWAASGCRRRA